MPRFPFFLLFLPLAAHAQENTPALLQAQHVTQVRILLGARLVATRRYDALGNKTAATDDSFLAETIKTSLTQAFNEQHQLVSSKQTHSAMKDTTFWRNRYDERGHLVAVTDGYSGREVRRLDVNAAGQLVKETQFDQAGQVDREVGYTYDAVGNAVAEQMDGPFFKGRVVRKAYDDQHREIKEEHFDGRRRTFTQLTNYAPEGDVSRVYYLEDSQKTGVAYTYGPNHQLLTRRHFTSKNEREITTGLETFTYLPTGLVQTYSEDIFSFRHEQRTFTYQYE